jgi:leucyl aminopeptidase
MHALGYNYAGVMGDDETTITRLEALSRTGEERVWRLPFNDHIGKSLKTDFADLRNISQEEFAGSSLGGVFLSHFRGKAKLTHLDIAGPSHRKTPYGHAPKGATGWGLLLLSEFFS